jgi:formate--tetrahydrofolate ligase
MQSDVEIAQAAAPRPILEIGARLGLAESDLVSYGRDVAKVDLSVLDRPRSAHDSARSPGRLVLVSAITPTPAGEGKTTTSIGLADGLARLGESVCLALREPSLGPSLGLKGGAAGGGYAQVIPMERINLHFTGDFHAITSANNLLAALVDNHLYQGNALAIDSRRVLWRRVMDLNDRSLRQIVLGLGGSANGVPRESGFDITAASEVMAILCLAEGIEDLRERIDRILVAFDLAGEPVFAKAFGGTGAMLALLKDALQPNLVQTLEGTPAFVHGGPFANIAHGCNSVLATRMSLHQADWTITEAGFGFDLGAEKFFNIKCVGAGLDPAAVVLVATVRALKMHGGVKRGALSNSDAAAVERGLPNLEKHIESIRLFGEVPVVALNHFAADSAAEIEVVERCCASLGVPFAVSRHHAEGGAGAEALARTVIQHAEKRSRPFRPLYAWTDPVADKIEAVATKMYGARHVTYTKSAQKDLAEIERLGFAGLPVCIAKLRGRPRGFDITVRGIQINSGAGFLVVLTGDILRMPGMPVRPLAESIDVREGRIVGLE